MGVVDGVFRTDSVVSAEEAPRRPALLSVEGLTIAYTVDGREVEAVRGLTFRIAHGEVLALVGESGSGKTSAALAVLNYLPREGRVISGDIRFAGESIVGLGGSARRKLFGRRIAHVAQDPSASLNPALKIRLQMTEGMVAQLGLDRAEALRRASALLEEVHLREPARVLDAYPHQLSGGMQQRVCIAMALACDPELMIMDEPTTGLDAATESAIFDLLRELRARRSLSVLFISHNLAAVSSLADRVLVLYAGNAVEEGPTQELFERPAHRYSAMLIRSLPTMRSMEGMPIEIPWQATQIPETGCSFRDRCDIARPQCAGPVPLVPVARNRRSACVMAQALLQAPASRPLKTFLDEDARTGDMARSGTSDVLKIEDLEHTYRKSIWASRAAAARKTLADLSLTIGRGEVLALIGESGSGKSTLARCIVGLESTQAGRMDFEGYDLAKPGRRPVSVSRKLQIVFQNIAGSLHPGKLVREILRRPFELYERRRAPDEELAALVESVGLKEQYLAKRTPALSGGERQRVAIARATSSSPSLIVLDEAFSALDVSMKVKVMRLLQERRAATALSLLLITHDLPIVRFMADRVAVLYRGWLCEVGPKRIIESPPMHPYTEALMWSALGLEGLRPRHLDLAKMATTDRTGGLTSDAGCPYRGRCPRYLGAQCDAEAPPFQEAAAGHRIACHIPINKLRDLQAAEWTAREFSKDAHVG